MQPHALNPRVFRLPPGENLAQYFRSFRDVTQAWYDEVVNYRYDGQFSEATGHFTQVSTAALALACKTVSMQLWLCRSADIVPAAGLPHLLALTMQLEVGHSPPTPDSQSSSSAWQTIIWCG